MPFGPLEIAIVAIIALIIFGQQKLPELARSAGTGLRDFKRSVAGGDDDDAGSLAGSAGKGMRELRELKDAITGDELRARELRAEQETAAATRR